MTFMTINTNQAKGTISLFQSDYGADVIVNGRVVATVDLFYLSERGEAAGVPPGCYGKQEFRQGFAVRTDDDGTPVIHILPEPKMNVMFIQADGEVYAIFPDVRVNAHSNPLVSSSGEMLQAFTHKGGFEFVHQDWVEAQFIHLMPSLPESPCHSLYNEVEAVYNATINVITSFDKMHWYNIRNGGTK